MINEDSDINSKIADKTEIVPNYNDTITEKDYPKFRGPDRKPRIVNRNSIQNLKQCRNNPKLTELILAKYIPKTSDLGSKLLTGLVILVLALFGSWIICKIYKYYSSKN